jgi:hypothetical protein
MIVEFPDGTTVQACGIGRDGDPEPDFGLYLDEQWDPVWPHVRIAWPDFGVPRDINEAARAIEAAFERAQGGERVEVGCHGGLGRTGTVLACMAVSRRHP